MEDLWSDSKVFPFLLPSIHQASVLLDIQAFHVPHLPRTRPAQKLQQFLQRRHCHRRPALMPRPGRHPKESAQGSSRRPSEAHQVEHAMMPWLDMLWNPPGLEAKRDTSQKIWPACLVIHLRTQQYSRVVQTSKSPLSHLIFRLHPRWTSSCAHLCSVSENFGPSSSWLSTWSVGEAQQAIPQKKREGNTVTWQSLGPSLAKDPFQIYCCLQNNGIWAISGSTASASARGPERYVAFNRLLARSTVGSPGSRPHARTVVHHITTTNTSREHNQPPLKQHHRTERLNATPHKNSFWAAHWLVAHIKVFLWRKLPPAAGLGTTPSISPSVGHTGRLYHSDCSPRLCAIGPSWI